MNIMSLILSAILLLRKMCKAALCLAKTEGDGAIGQAQVVAQQVQFLRKIIC